VQPSQENDCDLYTTRFLPELKLITHTDTHESRAVLEDSDSTTYRAKKTAGKSASRQILLSRSG
jgi:hypothetical protein